MNRNRKIPAKFEPETEFEPKLTLPAPFRDAQENRFESLKNRLLRERLGEGFEAEFNSYLRRAANEAAALAWITAYPLLVFPALFEEKADLVVTRAERQESIRERSRELLMV